MKPFSATELGARIKASLRRRAVSEPEEPYVLGDLVVDFAERRVVLGGEPVTLTPIEHRTLVELAANAGRVVTHEQLLRRVWGLEVGDDLRPMRTAINSIRRRLGDDAANPTYIYTEARVGYRMARPEPPANGGTASTETSQPAARRRTPGDAPGFAFRAEGSRRASTWPRRPPATGRSP